MTTTTGVRTMTKALPPPERKVLHGEIIPPGEPIKARPVYMGVDIGSLVGQRVFVVVRGGKVIKMGKA